jgi:hypothetical protein
VVSREGWTPIRQHACKPLLGQILARGIHELLSWPYARFFPSNRNNPHDYIRRTSGERDGDHTKRFAPLGKGPADYFTGTVRVDPLFEAPEPARVRGADVTFEPGARTAWHTHPLGQTLIVTSGLGRVQREGGPMRKSVQAMSCGSHLMRSIGTARRLPLRCRTLPFRKRSTGRPSPGWSRSQTHNTAANSHQDNSFRNGYPRGTKAMQTR